MLLIFSGFLGGKKKTAKGKKEAGKEFINLKIWGFPGGAVVKNLPANAGNTS